MIIPLPRTLKRGDKGKDVLMVKRALSEAKYRPWGFGFSTGFGSRLEKDIKNFQKDHNLKVDGVYGLATHKLLAPYFDAYGAKTMVELMPDTPVEVQAALVTYNNNSLVRYTQTASRMMIVRYKLKPLDTLRNWFRAGKQLWEDCSSSVTGYFYIAGKKDPNGYVPGYPGYGYTGTLSTHGVRVSSPKPGDLGFYGGGWPYHHVVICVGFKNGVPMVVSHGSDRGPLFLAYNYRGDFSHWRRYS